MVRLKDGRKTCIYTLIHVSIPYGTIKRSYSVFALSISDVSIPYGTIKSLPYEVQEHQNQVSIPYGTIKSEFIQVFFSVPLLVSIPYGTIKSAGPLIAGAASVMFQFLMVRLKEALINQLIGNTDVSIPYGTIKSE